MNPHTEPNPYTFEGWCVLVDAELSDRNVSIPEVKRFAEQAKRGYYRSLTPAEFVTELSEAGKPKRRF